jgi:uncharacterized protein YndB with AHSA1/START domain
VPTFDDDAITSAPVEEVWKLLYDPSRFPAWWEGVEMVERRRHEGRGDFTMFPDGYPDFPMPQELRADATGRQVTVSCLVSDLVFAWRLEPLPGDRGTRIAVHVEIPEQEAHRLERQRAAVSASLRSLASLAAATAAPPAPG